MPILLVKGPSYVVPYAKMKHGSPLADYLCPGRHKHCLVYCTAGLPYNKNSNKNHSSYSLSFCKFKQPDLFSRDLYEDFKSLLHA